MVRISRLKIGGGPVYARGMSDNGFTTNLTQARSIAWLDRGGVRPTRQRLALAALLVGDGLDRHVTAESLHESAARDGEPVALATVYNTLRAFCDAGLLREITVDGSKSYFDTNMSQHPHFFWEDSATLTDAPAAELDIRRLPAAPQGAEIAAVDVVIRLRPRPAGP
jgi:Fur family transcriptional regulator, iron response regulator